VANFTDEQLQRLIDAWEKDFGAWLSISEARLEASRVVRFSQLLSEQRNAKTKDANRTP